MGKASHPARPPSDSPPPFLTHPPALPPLQPLPPSQPQPAAPPRRRRPGFEGSQRAPPAAHPRRRWRRPTRCSSRPASSAHPRGTTCSATGVCAASRAPDSARHRGAAVGGRLARDEQAREHPAAPPRGPAGERRAPCHPCHRVAGREALQPERRGPGGFTPCQDPPAATPARRAPRRRGGGASATSATALRAREGACPQSRPAVGRQSRSPRARWSLPYGTSNRRRRSPRARELSSGALGSTCAAGVSPPSTRVRAGSQIGEALAGESDDAARLGCGLGGVPARPPARRGLCGHGG